MLLLLLLLLLLLPPFCCAMLLMLTIRYLVSSSKLYTSLAIDGICKRENDRTVSWMSLEIWTNPWTLWWG
ncbi:hypothetical protein BO99DRAFT_402722 [Aspergillus violaceofuscus CBS 115571]|uniref:Secreted peptide n=1 Tax=Aspergillus violaceofuscus (strain CBS 115571) TaxID=1450538 RepID=A0A2V5IHY4_ASPV1|nr:hypothetical protein BO99DRAFT_402722 [Aspergillus violaceofuscus CBS 115571]